MLTLKPFTRRIMVGRWCTSRIPPQLSDESLHFHYARRFATSVLAHMLDSLVRVSRRGKENHFVRILSTHDQRPALKARTEASVSPATKHMGYNSHRGDLPPHMPTPARSTHPDLRNATGHRSLKQPMKYSTASTLVSFGSFSAISGTL